MNMQVSEVKLPRLNTIIASQADRNKFIAKVKASYEDADDIKVTDNGGLCFDYQVMRGAQKGSVLRIPKAAVLKFSQNPDNVELDPNALTTLKAQLDAWANDSIQGEAQVYTEYDKIILLSTYGAPERAKFIMAVTPNGLIDETSDVHSAGFTSIRSDVASKVNDVVAVTSVKADQIISQLLTMVNGTDELTADLPRLFDDEIILPAGPLIDGYSYTAQIVSTSLDYFGKIEFTIDELSEPEEPVDPVEVAFFSAPETLILNNKSGQAIDPASIHNVVYAPVYDAATKTTMINLDLAASQDTLFDMETYIYIGDAEFEAMLNQKIADGSTDVLFRMFSPAAPEQFLDVKAENINNNPLLMTAQINGRLALRVPVHQDLPSGLYSLAFSDDGFVTTRETHTYGWQTNLTVKPDPLESVYLGGQESIRGKQGATMDLRLSLTPDDAEIDSVVWEVTPATGLTITPTEDGLYATLTVDQDFDETTAGNVTLTATVNGTTTIVKTLVIAVTTHDAVAVPLIRFDTNNPTVGTTLYNYIDFLPYENQEIKSTEFTFSPAENVEVISATDGYFKPLVPGEITVGLTVILQDDTELTTSQTVHAVE